MSKTKKFKTVQQRENLRAWLFFAPATLYYTVFGMFPVLFVLIISLTDWQGLYLANINFIGFRNFSEIFVNPDYQQMFINTVIMGGIILILSIIISFFVAQIMIKDIKGRAIHRAAWYIPGIISFAVISSLVSNMILPSGIINRILDQFNIAPIAWTGSTFWMFFFIIIISVWRGLGGNMLLFMAGLTSIPNTLYEVGKIEGCNAFQKMWYITMPMIKPIFSFVLITSMIGMFNIFEPIQLISKGGPEGTTRVIMFQIYSEAFENFNMGMSSAISVVVMIIVMILTAFNMKFTKLKI